MKGKLTRHVSQKTNPTHRLQPTPLPRSPYDVSSVAHPMVGLCGLAHFTPPMGLVVRQARHASLWLSIPSNKSSPSSIVSAGGCHFMSVRTSILDCRLHMSGTRLLFAPRLSDRVYGPVIDRYDGEPSADARVSDPNRTLKLPS